MKSGKKPGISRNTLNLTIDIALLVFLLAIACIGFMMKYTLLSGQDRLMIYGSRTDLAVLGITKHQWGDIHLILSLIFMALLLLHIILHWSCIESFFRRIIPSVMARTIIAILAVLIILIALAGPFFIKPRQIPFRPHYRNRMFYNNSRPEKHRFIYPGTYATDISGMIPAGI